MAEIVTIILLVALFVISVWAGMKMKGILSIAALVVFLPACATAGGYGPINPITGAPISTSDVLCGAIGVGGGLGTAKQTKNVGFGILVGAAGALICKAISGAWETRDYQVVHHPSVGYPQVHHQPGAVVIPSGAYIPDGYQTERIDVQNATRGVIFVRTPQGMVRVEPGGMVSFYEAISTGAGGAFYVVHATATVQVPGGYQSKWASAEGNSNGTLARTVVFRDFRWDNKIVPAHAATRHEIVPPVEVHVAPGVKSEPTPPPSPPK